MALMKKRIPLIVPKTKGGLKPGDADNVVVYEDEGFYRVRSDIGRKTIRLHTTNDLGQAIKYARDHAARWGIENVVIPEQSI